MKLRSFSKAIPYILTLAVGIILFGVILLAAGYGKSMEGFIRFTEVPLSSFILFHIFILEFIISNLYCIIFGVFIIILIFELKCKSLLKNKIRTIFLCAFIFILNLFTISFLCGIINQTRKSIHSQIISHHIKKSMELKSEGLETK